MRRGLHWPYDTPAGAPAETWRLLELASATGGLIVIPSHAPESDYQGILESAIGGGPGVLWVIRAKTGPGHLGAWPEEILDYREWETERSLADSIEWCLARRIVPYVTLGCEPDIEMAREPVDDHDNMRAAINRYCSWVWVQREAIRARFGSSVMIAAAALSQGSDERFAQWVTALGPIIQRMDWICEHCYTDGRAMDDQSWGGRWRRFAEWYPGHPLIITEINDNGAMWHHEGPEARDRHLGDYASALLTASERFPELLGAAGFSLPGGAQDAAKPAWWFWTESTCRAWMDAQPAVPVPDVPPPAPPEEIIPPSEPLPVIGGADPAEPWAYWSAAQIAAITQCPVANVLEDWPLIYWRLHERGISDKAVCAAVIATVAIESARTFKPVREAFWLSEQWRAANLRYFPWYGRGHIQLTWYGNYVDAGEAIGEDITTDPDRAMESEISAKVCAWYIDTHRALDPDYGIVAAARAGDLTEVRRLVQGGSAGLPELVAMVTALMATMDDEGEDMARIAELEEQNAALRTYIGVLTGDDPGNVKAALVAAANARTRAQMRSSVIAATSTLDRLGHEALGTAA
jgi:predicted chitinase